MPQFSVLHFTDRSGFDYRPDPTAFTIDYQYEMGEPIASYDGLDEAYDAADAASSDRCMVVYDRDNLDTIYQASPHLRSVMAVRPIEDRRLAFQTTRMDRASYLHWERSRISAEVHLQVVFCRDSLEGGPMSGARRPVTKGFYAHPDNMPAWLAILRDATIRPRSSGQTGASAAAELAALYGDSSVPVAHWTGWPTSQ